MKLNARAHGDASGLKLWGRRIRMNFTHMGDEPLSAEWAETGEVDLSVDGVGQQAEAAHIPRCPKDLPLTEVDYDLMRRALVRQRSVALVEQGYAHGLDVAQWCVRVARKRGLDEHTACLAGFLHDVYYYATGLRPLHAQNSAEQVRVLLMEHGGLSNVEQEAVCHTIFCHHDADKAHDALSELLRDAHILSEYTGGARTVRQRELRRLTELVPEWSLLEPQRAQVVEAPETVCQGNRAALAEVAQTLAAQRISWYAGEQDALAIARYWPEADAFDALSGNWCAAFVYHCCYEAGFLLPLRHPQVEQRFASIKGWLDFASLLVNGFYHPKGESGFVPERGDIVIFDRLLEDKQPADHMGVVVMTSPERITVAEGNARSSNVSDVIDHSATHHVRGYIRLPNDFRADAAFN